MLRVLVSLCIIVSCLFSTDTYFSDFNTALAKAKQENKLVMLTVVSTNCPWCKRFKTETLNDSEVSKVMKQDFVFVVLNRDTQEIPVQFKSRLVPTTFFLNSSGQKITTQAVGYFDAVDFMDFLVDAIKKGKK